MFSHVMLGVNDLETSRVSNDAVLGTLGIGPGFANKNCHVYTSPGGLFAITILIDGESATHGNGSTIGFSAASAEQGGAFHAEGIANGGSTCEDPPGLREGGAYLAYLRYPDGNRICAIHRRGSRVRSVSIQAVFSPATLTKSCTALRSLESLDA